MRYNFFCLNPVSIILMNIVKIKLLLPLLKKVTGRSRSFLYVEIIFDFSV